jgi:EAL domain-containing protein (putative c-di-GMP-specific phosphodiesterase class I)
MNEIAHLLGRRTAAEHVNSESIHQLLEEIAIDCGQGCYLGRTEPHGAQPELRSMRSSSCASHLAAAAIIKAMLSDATSDRLSSTSFSRI